MPCCKSSLTLSHAMQFNTLHSFIRCHYSVKKIQFSEQIPSIISHTFPLPSFSKDTIKCHSDLRSRTGGRRVRGDLARTRDSRPLHRAPPIPTYLPGYLHSISIYLPTSLSGTIASHYLAWYRRELFAWLVIRDSDAGMSIEGSGILEQCRFVVLGL